MAAPGEPAGRCEESSACQDDRDCADGQYCAPGEQSCQDGCWDQAQCAKGTYCNTETHACEEGCRGTEFWFDCSILKTEVCVGNECKSASELANELCENTPFDCCEEDEECGEGIDCHPFLSKCIPCGVPLLGRCKDPLQVCVRGFGDIGLGRCKSAEPCDTECNPNEPDHGVAECRDECPESELPRECVASRTGAPAVCLPRCCGEQDCAEGNACVLCECKEGCRTEADCPPAGPAAPDGYECDKTLLEEINPWGLGDCVGIAPCDCTQADANEASGEPGCALGTLCDGCKCRDRCRSDDDCSAENNRCMNIVEGYGTCQAECLEGCDDSVRDTQGPCDPGKLCDGCHCVAGCFADADCPEGNICGAPPEQGYAQCTLGCRDDSNCPRGRTCQNPDEDGIGTCEMGACGRDCGAGRVCDPERGTCQKECDVPVDCDDNPCRLVLFDCVPGEGGKNV